MSFIVWDMKYLLGNEQIDAEHQYLFRLINEFHDAFIERHERARLLALLNRLVDYAQKHFTHEEQLMREANYPRLETHHALHEQLFEQIFVLNAKLENRAYNPTHETFLFLRHWLSDHIIDDDLQFGSYLKVHQNQTGNGAAADAEKR